MKHKKLMIIISIILILIGLVLIIKSNVKSKNDDKKSYDILDKNESEDRSMEIIINNKTYDVLLENNETVKELLEKLPDKVMMTELNGNEKYYYFNTSFKSNPENISLIETGDVMLYGDNCLVIFYKDFKTSYKYTRIGKIKNPIDLEKNLGDKEVEVSFKK